MSNPREVARYTVELRWHAPRTWGAKNLPHGGRFYGWALFESPRRQLWTYTDATGVIGPGGIEITEIAIITAEDDSDLPDVQPGEHFGFRNQTEVPFSSRPSPPPAPVPGARPGRRSRC